MDKQSRNVEKGGNGPDELDSTKKLKRGIVQDAFTEEVEQKVASAASSESYSPVPFA